MAVCTVCVGDRQKKVAAIVPLPSEEICWLMKHQASLTLLYSCIQYCHE